MLRPLRSDISVPDPAKSHPVDATLFGCVPAGQGRPKRDVLLTEFEQSGESQVSLTNPDSRAMAGHSRVAVGYNMQIAVDRKHKLLVEQQVTNQVVDMGLLQQTAEPAREILDVEQIDVVADRAKGLMPSYYKHCLRPQLRVWFCRRLTGPRVRCRNL
jgi:hypothetical protein